MVNKSQIAFFFTVFQLQNYKNYKVSSAQSTLKQRIRVTVVLKKKNSPTHPIHIHIQYTLCLNVKTNTIF